MKWRVELTWYSSGSFGPLASVAYRIMRVRPGQQQAGRLAAGVALDLAAGRVRRVAGVADGAQRGAVEQGAVVEVQDEHRRVRRDRVELVQRRQALLGELEFAEAADHAHPLRRRRALGLARAACAIASASVRHAVPAQLEVVVQAAADQVHVAVVEPGNDAAAAQVDACRAGTGERISSAVADRGEARRSRSRPPRPRAPRDRGS